MADTITCLDSTVQPDAIEAPPPQSRSSNSLKLYQGEGQIFEFEGSNETDEDDSDIEYSKPCSGSTLQLQLSPTSNKTPWPVLPDRKQNTKTKIEAQLDFRRETADGNTINDSTTEPSSSDSFNLNGLSPNATQVSWEDVTFSLLVFCGHLLSLGVDLVLIFGYYVDEWKWCSGLTFAFVLAGGVGILRHFTIANKDRLNKLFTYGGRLRIVVNCFPPCATVICSYCCLQAAWRARGDQMYSVKFFVLEEFYRSLSRIQGFFHSAPQAVLQLTILLESGGSDETGFGMRALAISSLGLSLLIMTLANLPGRNDVVGDNSRRATISPPSSSRIFLGVRMMSSFGSRTMALGYFFMGLRCLLGNSLTVPSVIFGISVIVFPRLAFGCIEYALNLSHGRWGPLGSGSGSPSCCSSFTGYLATICFPMSYPLWVFWFIWAETLVFIAWGNITVWSISQSCISNLANVLYTGGFLIAFLIVPILLPYATASAKRSREKKLQKLFWSRNREFEMVQNQNQNIDGTHQHQQDSNVRSSNENVV